MNEAEAVYMQVIAKPNDPNNTKRLAAATGLVNLAGKRIKQAAVANGIIEASRKIEDFFE